MTESSNILTVGYQGLTPDAFVARLKASQVEVLVDARFRPQSRKAGFSKSRLARLLESAGIQYEHERDFGTPPEIMDNVRSQGGYSGTDYVEYRAYLRTKQDSLRRVAALATEKKICLMCYESDYRGCHRTIVAEELAKLNGINIRHL